MCECMYSCLRFTYCSVSFSSPYTVALSYNKIRQRNENGNKQIFVQFFCSSLLLVNGVLCKVDLLKMSVPHVGLVSFFFVA